MTLRLAESTRAALMSLYGRMHDGALSETLSGRTATGEPARLGHAHAHYLPADEDGDGWLDHLNVWAPRGFNEADLRALSALTRVRVQLGQQPSEVVLVHVSALYAGGLEAVRNLNWIGPARVWASGTPFVPGRHPKLRGKGEGRHPVDTPVQQILQELRSRGLPDPVKIQPLPAVESPWTPRSSWLEYEWLRHRVDRRRPGGTPSGWTITFAKPVMGPIVIGYGCHFGLGQFWVGG